MAESENALNCLFQWDISLDVSHPSVWSFRDPCEACGKTLTQSLASHPQKYHCKRLETEKQSMEECPKWAKMVSATTIYSHAKKRMPKTEKKNNWTLMISTSINMAALCQTFCWSRQWQWYSEKSTILRCSAAANRTFPNKKVFNAWSFSVVVSSPEQVYRAWFRLPCNLCQRISWALFLDQNWAPRWRNP